MTKRRKGPVYAWYMAGVGLTCYGFGVSPGYYSWGFYARPMMEELDLSKQDIGSAPPAWLV